MGVYSFQANQGTQTNLLGDNTGGTASSGTFIPIYKLSLDTQGTFTTGNLWSGAVIEILPGQTVLQGFLSLLGVGKG